MEVSKRIRPNSDIAGKLRQKEGGKKKEILIRMGNKLLELLRGFRKTQAQHYRKSRLIRSDIRTRQGQSLPNAQKEDEAEEKSKTQ